MKSSKESRSDEEETAVAPDRNQLPIDRGWAWAILIGAVLEMMIVIGIMKSTGIFFVELQRQYSATSSMISLISTIQNGVYSICSLVVMTVGMKMMSCRVSLLIGSFVTCAAYIITGMTKSYGVVMFSHGVLQGIGLAFLQPCTVVMVGRFFDKRRGLAMSIAVSGGSVGGLVLAPLLTALFQHYGYQGAFLIIGSFFLHCCVTGALFRSLDSFAKKPTVPAVQTCNRDGYDNAKDPPLKNGMADSEGSKPLLLPLKIDDVRFISDSKLNETKSSLLENHVYQKTNGSPLTLRQRTYTETSAHSRVEDMIKTLTHSSLAMYASADCIATPSALLENDESAKKPKAAKGVVSFFKAFVAIFDFSLFKNPLLIVFLCGASQLVSACALISVYLAPHVKESGLSLSEIALLLAIISAVDTFSRIFIGYISDKKFVRRSTLVGIATVLLGFLAHLIRFFQGFSGFVVFAVFLGILSGVYFALFAVIIVDYLTLAKMHSALGFTTLTHGASVALSFAVVGAIRDATGSYLIPFHFLGTQAIIGGLLISSLAVVEKCMHEKDTRNKELSMVK